MIKEEEISRVEGRGGKGVEAASVAAGDASRGSTGVLRFGVGSAAVASAREVEAKEEGYISANER
jgi:hypothetical protein